MIVQRGPYISSIIHFGPLDEKSALQRYQAVSWMAEAERLRALLKTERAHSRKLYADWQAASEATGRERLRARVFLCCTMVALSRSRGW